MSKPNKNILKTIILLSLVVFLFYLNLNKAKSISPGDTSNVIYNKETKTLDYSSLTLRQKIGQMIIGYGSEENEEDLLKMNIGGIFIWSMSEKEDFISLINNYQKNTVIPLFVSADMEGCINPFENFHQFPSLNEIKTKEEAYQVGYEEGELMNEIGFNMNFAPVVDLEDSIWNCRSFNGTFEEIAEKSNQYIRGLEANGIIATSKHYPGKALVVRDPHVHIVYATIDENDLFPFEENIENNVSAIMISHIIVDGEIESESKPSVASVKLTKELRKKFNGLIITDEIRMQGLEKYYSNIDDMYVDLFKAENDLILNFDLNSENIYHMISVVEDAVEKGEIPEERIDDSVVRILEAKGVDLR